MLNSTGGQFNTYQYNEHVGFAIVAASYLRRTPEYTVASNKYNRKSKYSSSGSYSYYKRGEKEYQKR
jgi:hypothetical protein